MPYSSQSSQIVSAIFTGFMAKDDLFTPVKPSQVFTCLPPPMLFWSHDQIRHVTKHSKWLPSPRNTRAHDREFESEIKPERGQHFVRMSSDEEFYDEEGEGRHISFGK